MVAEGDEKIDPKMTFNPALQYFNQVICSKMVMKPEERAKIGEDDPIPEMNQNIIDYVKPDRQMFEQASQEIEEFHKNFDLQLVDPDELKGKEKRRIYWKDLIA